ncbi:MAG: iron complex outermembrane receptor protein [Polaribacter sp.]|jgi:iron complex outermembrane receptor protein
MHKVLKNLLLFVFVFCCFQVEAKKNNNDENEKSIVFDIPAQRADLSLISFAEQANMTLLFPFNKLKEKQANRLSGKHSIKEGLSVLLKNTGLQVKYRKSGQLSITINKSFEEDNMKNIPKKTLIATLLAAFFTPTAVMAADADESADEGTKVLIIGSRSRAPRTIADSPVPIDILSADDLNAMGGTADLTDNLKMMVPSYTATPATGDGSAFVRTTSLRGTAPDQTLVLIDGKRRHRSALIQLFAPAAGQGAHGADVGMVPAIALKRVEVLRDGAASQYGSDAIAGVINFVTKDDSDGGMVELQYGQHYEGESSLKFGFNKGMQMGENGFANFSLEYTDNEALDRSILRPDAAALVAAGVPGIGADTPFGDAPLTQSWGRPETSGLRTFLNMGVDLGDDMNWYGRVGYGATEGRYRFFYRTPINDDLGLSANSAITALAGLGYTGNLLDVGFTPYLDGDQTDFSFITGLKGDFSGGTYYDFSVSLGSNELDYFLNNSVNPSLGTVENPLPQRDFDTGGLKQEETNINADFSTPMGDNFNFAYGAEWREETYTTIAGELNSYADANGDESGGVSGMKGITAADAGEFSRDNYAIYADLEHDLSSDLFFQYALRYEDFSDFGTTVNWKIASRFSLTDSTSLRGAISTGFHAPTPGQANYKATITTFDTTGAQVEEGVIASTDPDAVAAGGQELKEEESTSISFGVTSDIGESTTLTVDYYQIAVDDRIYRSGGLVSPAGRAFSFYTNALDVEHSGIDIVLTSDFEWSEMTSTNVSLAYGYNKIEVTGQSSVETFDPVSGLSTFVDPVSQGSIDNIENNFPNHRFVVTANTSFGDDWNFMVRGNYYGEHDDERGSFSDGTKAPIDSVFYVDAEVAYQVNEEFNMKLGFSNIFDSYVNKIGAPYSNRLSVGLEYPRRSAANYEGGSWYLKGVYDL